MINIKIKKKCVECNSTLRNYQPGDKPIHRKCWMSLRSKSERHYDHLFCKDIKKEQLKKVQIIEPIQEEDDLLPSPLERC